jgi:hypothetical protein
VVCGQTGSKPSEVIDLLKPEAAQNTSVKKPFECGDALRPGIPYSKLAKCYEQERDNYFAVIAASAQVYAKAKDDLAMLRVAFNQNSSAYDDLVQKYNEVLKQWTAEEYQCNAQDQRRVAEYNSLVGDYNRPLLSG